MSNSKSNKTKRRLRVWRRGRNGIAGKSLHIQRYFQVDQSESRAKPAEKLPPKYYLYGQLTPNLATRVSEIASNAATALTSQGKAVLHCQSDLAVFLGHLEIPMSGTGGVNPSFCSAPGLASLVHSCPCISSVALQPVYKNSKQII